MADALEQEIEKLLRNGKKKQEIWRILGNGTEPRKVLFHLNNSALPRDRKKFQGVNLTLALILLFLTSKKLIVAFSFGALDLILLLGLVVPVINVYVLGEILRFHRIGYQYLFILSLLALLQPENWHTQERILLGAMIGLSGYLLRQMFPARDRIVT